MKYSQETIRAARALRSSVFVFHSFLVFTYENTLHTKNYEIKSISSHFIDQYALFLYLNAYAKRMYPTTWTKFDSFWYCCCSCFLYRFVLLLLRWLLWLLLLLLSLLISSSSFSVFHFHRHSFMNYVPVIHPYIHTSLFVCMYPRDRERERL